MAVIQPPKTNTTPKKLTGEYAKICQELDGVIEEAKHKKEKVADAYEVINEPKKVKEAFLREEKTIPKLIAKIRNQQLPIQRELKEPLLFLMKENGYTDIIEGVKTGEFIISTPKGEKGMILSPDKFTTLKYGEQYYKCWIAYENCMSPYPENPIHNAEMYRKTTQKLAMNWRDRDEAMVITARTKMWLYIIGAVVIGLVLLLSTPFGKSLMAGMGKQAVTQVATTIQQNISTATGGIAIQ